MVVSKPCVLARFQICKICYVFTYLFVSFILFIYLFFLVKQNRAPQAAYKSSYSGIFTFLQRRPVDRSWGNTKKHCRKA